MDRTPVLRGLETLQKENWWYREKKSYESQEIFNVETSSPCVVHLKWQNYCYFI